MIFLVLAGATSYHVLLQKMQQLQYRVYAESQHSLLIVLQGLNAAGKDGAVRLGLVVTLLFGREDTEH